MSRKVGLADPETGWLADLFGLPWRRYRLETHLTRDQIREALRKITEPAKSFRPPWHRSLYSFEGEVTEAGFKLRRIIRYRNTMRPVVEGSFEQSPIGLQVKITMRPAWHAATLLLTYAIVTVSLLARESAAGRVNAILILPVLVIGYVVASIFFGVEARRARDLLFRTISGSLN